MLQRPGFLPGKSAGGMPPMMGAAGLGSIPKAVGGIIGGMPLLGGPGLLRPPLGGVLPGLIRPGAAPLVSLAASTSKAPAPAGPLSKAVAPGLVPPAGGSVAVPPLGEPQPCTVYVGRISSEVSDDFVKHLLEKCGKISKWNRAADPNTSKLTSFGFCDFEEPEGVWRALEFLHEQQLCDKRLLVKCEEKAKQTIEAWKASKQDTLAKKRKEGDDEKKEGDDEKKEGNDEKKMAAAAKELAAAEDAVRKIVRTMQAESGLNECACAWCRVMSDEGWRDRWGSWYCWNCWQWWQQRRW